MSRPKLGPAGRRSQVGAGSLQSQAEEHQAQQPSPPSSFQTFQILVLNVFNDRNLQDPVCLFLFTNTNHHRKFTLHINTVDI